MPRRHGALVSEAGDPKCLFGICQVFDPWIDPRLLAMQGYNFPPTTRPLLIESHFRRVVQRLVRSLARLQQRAREWDQFLEAGGLAGPHPELAFEIPEEGGIAADSVFHYLHLFIDDIARVIPFVLVDDGPDAKEPDGFTDLKRMVLADDLLTPMHLRELFLELDGEDSWWVQGFKRGAGIRQRLTHYTDLVLFHGGAKSGGPKMTGDVSLASVGGPVHVKDFESTLEALFVKLCEWLDRLDQPLLAHLSARLAKRGVSWDPLGEPCPAVTMPTQGEVRAGARHYLYFSLCRESPRGV